MKPFHEVAVVRDGKTRVGWLIKKGVLQSLSMVEYVDEAKFVDLVKQGKIQYFEYENGRLKIAYTDEELFEVRGLNTEPITNLKEYLSLDMALQYKPLQEALTVSNGRPYAYVIGETLVPPDGNGTFVNAMVYSNDIMGIWRKILLELEKIGPQMVTFVQAYSRIAPNYISLSYIPLSLLKNIGFNITYRRN